MTKSRLLPLFLAAVCLLMVASGCTRDPNVRKQKYLASGNKYMDEGKYREAVIQYANAVKVDRGFADAHYGLAKAYMKLQTWNGAYAELLRTVELQPDNLKAQLDLGNLFLAGGKPNDAREKANFVLSKDSRNGDAYILLGSVAGSERKTSEALADFDKALEISPNKAEYHLNKALLLLSDKQTAAAEASAKKATELDPKLAVAHTFLANFYWSQERWDDSERELKTTISAVPQDLGARVRLASFYLARQQKDRAEQVVTQAKKDLAANDPNAHALLAEFFLGQAQTDRALAEFASSTSQFPKDLTLKKRYIEVLLMTNHNEEATKLVDEMLKKNPKDIEGLMFRASLQMSGGKVADAIQGLETAVKTDAQNAFAHYMLGAALLSKGDRMRAANELREAVRLRPNLLQAQRVLADVAAQSRNMDELESIAATMIQNAPGWPEGYIRRAEVEYSRKQLDKAEADLKKAMEVAPQNPAGTIRMAEFRMSQKRYPDAEKLLEQVLQQNPASVQALGDLVAIYMDQKQPDKALARIKAQLEKVPNSTAYYQLLGTVQAQQKDLPTAEVSLRKAADLDKKNVTALMLLGQVQTMQGSPDKAIATYQEFLQKDPNDVRGYLLLASLMELKQNWQQAEDLLQKVLAMQPENGLAANNLAYLMLQHGGNPDVALTLAQTARRVLPESPNVADTLAMAYYQKGIYSSAADLLEDAIKKQPASASMHYHLGMVYSKVEKPALAREHLDKALKLNLKAPDSDQARKMLQSIKG
ncbi:MAG: tetratricopeptide repeat protein [Terriglobales bacterium]